MITLDDIRQATEGMPGDTVLVVDSSDGGLNLVFARPVAVVKNISRMPRKKILCIAQKDVEDLVDAFTTEPKRDC